MLLLSDFVLGGYLLAERGERISNWRLALGFELIDSRGQRRAVSFIDEWRQKLDVRA